MKAVAVTLLGCCAFGCGCAKVAPHAGKVIAGAEKVAVKATPVAEQAVPRAGQTVGQRARAWANRADNAMDAYDRYQQLTAAPAGAPPERFPYPASSVVTTSRQSIVINQFGTFALPNNYAGYSFFDASGRPLGFSAWNYSLREERYFDSFGNGL